MLSENVNDIQTRIGAHADNTRRSAIAIFRIKMFVTPLLEINPDMVIITNTFPERRKTCFPYKFTSDKIAVIVHSC